MITLFNYYAKKKIKNKKYKCMKSVPTKITNKFFFSCLAKVLSDNFILLLWKKENEKKTI